MFSSGIFWTFIPSGLTRAASPTVNVGKVGGKGASTEIAAMTGATATFPSVTNTSTSPFARMRTVKAVPTARTIESPACTSNGLAGS